MGYRLELQGQTILELGNYNLDRGRLYESKCQYVSVLGLESAMRWYDGVGQ